MTKEIRVGKTKIGGGNKIAVQSMTNTKTSDVESTIGQIIELEDAGCDIVRASVYDAESARAIKRIKDKISIPIVADVHFDYKLAISAIENGADKIRINPGNIGERINVEKVCACAKEHKIPIRVGANGGSVEKSLLKEFGNTPKALALSVIENVKILEQCGFSDIVLSAKSSNVKKMIEVNRILSAETSYPLHLGVTEAGSQNIGIYKSAVGIGSLLCDGIGDTIRVSLTGNPVQEVLAAHKILRSVGVEENFIEIISCPTCGRTSINLEKIVDCVEKATCAINKKLKVAIMGCVVNGPGEAADADIGIAGGDGKCAVFKNGKVFKTVDESLAVEVLLEEIGLILGEKIDY